MPINIFNATSGKQQASDPDLDALSNPTLLSVYAAGTAYSLTDSTAALDFGTTDPVLTITAPGTYLILARANLLYNGATFEAAEDVTLKLRRTNNTASDLTNSTHVIKAAIVTTLTGALGAVGLPDIIYTTTNSDDAITIYGHVATAPSAGSLDVTSASIIAVRLKA